MVPAMTTPAKRKVTIRWMIRADLKEVTAIDGASFEFPWGDSEFIRCLRTTCCSGMVADDGQRIVGFMVYELHKKNLHILNFAVRPGYRRRGIGSAMVDVLKAKLTAEGRSRLSLEIRETNVDAQVFFKAMGFRAVLIAKDFYRDTTEDAYLFQFKKESGE